MLILCVVFKRIFIRAQGRVYLNKYPFHENHLPESTLQRYCFLYRDAIDQTLLYTRPACNSSVFSEQNLQRKRSSLADEENVKASIDHGEGRRREATQDIL